MDMYYDVLNFCNGIGFNLTFFNDHRNESGFFICALPLWIVGVLGNLVNVAVFSHKNMAHPINSIFLWLSISDLLELAVFASYQWVCNWCGWIQILNYRYVEVKYTFMCVLILINPYLLQVFHTITIGLNIVLAFCQYVVVAYPLINQKNPFNNQFIKYTIIWIYILSFVLYLPYWYIYEIYSIKDFNGHFIEYAIGWRLNQDGSEWPKDPLLHICFLVCGVVLRIGPLIILIILCTLLLLAINNAHRKRRNLGMEARQLSKAQRKVNRMNVTITIVITMFLVTELPSGISTLLGLSSDSYYCSFAIDYYSLLLVMLLNCSYSIFCYLIRIKEYRETLKLLLNTKSK